MSTTLPEPERRSLPDVSPSSANTRQMPPDTEMEPVVIHIGVLAYLRTMWAIFWTAFRYPFRTTYIDAATGEILYDYDAGK